MARKYPIFVNEHCIEVIELTSFDAFPIDATDVQPQEIYDSYLYFKDLNTTPQLQTFFTKNWKSLLAELFQLFVKIEAAGGLVFNPEGETLWIKRLGKWDLPKGKIEPDEAPEMAAIREISEECDLAGNELHLIVPLRETYHTYTMRGKHVLKITWWYEVLYTGSASGSPQLEEAITEVKWLSNSEVKKQVLPNTYGNIRLLTVGLVT
jgi:8-oxo-dGTP pyrophosphatase MutT (NUDIX family)